MKTPHSVSSQRKKPAGFAATNPISISRRTVINSRLYSSIYRVVRRIPPGTVSTYGDVAAICSHDVSPRVVGWAMAVCPASIPWHRVINREGKLSTARRSVMLAETQQALLENEGITFRENGSVDLEEHRWRPRRSKPSRRRTRV